MNRLKLPLKRTLKNIGLVWVLAASFVSQATGQVEVEDMEDKRGQIYRMKITAAAAPSPVLKYRFSVMPHETIAANAATLYLRSFGESSLSRPHDKAYKEHGEAFYDWQSNSGVPIEKLLETPAPEVSKWFDGYIEKHIQQATLCRYCDWGLGEEDLKGVAYIDFLLPSVQETRSISRTLAFQTRVAIAEKRFDRAVELMRMNYQLAQNVGKIKFLVGSLVAIAEVGITNGTLVDFIGTPESPNMYWALTELPRPIVSIRDSMRLELNFVDDMFPEIFAAEEADSNVEAWKLRAENIMKSGYICLIAFTTGSSGSELVEKIATIEGKPTPDQLSFKLAPMFMGLLAYQKAKQQLLEDGDEPDKVEAMPVAQVVTIAMARDLSRTRENMERWIYLPHSIAFKELVREEEETYGFKGLLLQPGRMIAGWLFPATGSIYGAQMRIERDLDALRVIEAIRMHVAETGALPTTLDEISVVPVPLNPATNKPFSYKLKNGIATLDLPPSDGINFSKRFELRL